MADLKTTRRMLGALEALDRPSSFLLDRFFPTLVTFDEERIDFDLLDRAEALAPFVSPNVQGKAMKERGHITRSFEPAYVKPKNAIKPRRSQERRPGEPYLGELSAGERHELAALDLLEDHRRKIIRRKEWMAAQALTAGSVTVAGAGYETQEVDFQRDASLTVTLLSAARWGESGVSPMDNIEEWASSVADVSGATITDVIFDPKAWQLARREQGFLDALDNRRQMSGGVELGPTPAGGENRRGRYLGSIGELDYWLYQQPYVADDGTAAKMLPDYSVILGCAEIEGAQCHGAILDPKAGYAPVEMFPKRWVEDDPAQEFLMTQSAPLVVPRRPDASFYAKVR